MYNSAKKLCYKDNSNVINSKLLVKINNLISYNNIFIYNNITGYITKHIFIEDKKRYVISYWKIK